MIGEGDKKIRSVRASGVFLERAARLHTLGAGAGCTPTFPAQAARDQRRGQIMSPVHIEHCWNYFGRKLDCRAATQGDPRVIS